MFLDGLKNLYRKKLLQHYKSKCYNGIDELPVFNWWKVHGTNDLTFLYRIKKNISSANESECLVEVWRAIYDEYIERFGFSESYLEILNKRKQIAMMEIDMALSGDTGLKTLINVEKDILDKVVNSQVKGDFMDIKVAIEKQLKFHLNIKDISVAEFYSYVKNATQSTRKTDE